ncbi:MAG: uracil-DNA glycosylase, partial [Defluviitaleaceae bacterium]|nr:uracil-DNA glycosylase [Defluviitaleaceae bacterium]
MIKIGNDWDEFTQNEQEKPYYQDLRTFLRKEYAEKTIYPPMEEIFSAFIHTAYSDVSVVILGQDPYIKPNEAHGMSFSVNPGVRIPPSLKNIFAELESDMGCFMPNNGYLMPWAKQGVLLLNATL